ncbi:acyl-CoA dehydrogenase [Persicimonas caeni]|uniref:Acyl-CoA dehydrogenase n=1 Tax=Persicimonas caeni TaxID=2292766 RepID=A0A4Y6PTF2_PERCE|nr:acyl-CoA dehydrogenase family protein [Persicimonas caeni]QDG51530.1 acyl-CoA dehydrogenase [Persicimonas caeni]QED32751.1 acyl-CoA dehydrogenase [Persicimonas caeni]
MDFGIDDQQRKRLDTIAEFVREELEPLESEFVGKSFRALVPTLEEKRKKVKDLGLWAPHLPEEHGGLGLSLVDFGMIAEELGRSPVGHYVFNCQAPDAGNMEILIEHATDEQRAKYLDPLVRGEIRSCFSMTEPEYAGANPTQMGTTAVKDGDEYVINGRKWFTSSADGASFAVVMAVTNPEAESRYMKASQILVPTDTPGFNLVRNISVMGEPGDDYASHAEIVYDDCRVPIDNRLGPEGAGFMIAQQRLGPGRIHHCMRWIGICERAFELMVERAATRELYPGTMLGDKQMVQAKIADSRAEIDAARMLVLRTAWEIERSGQKAARIQISAIKFYVANVLQNVLDRAIQVHGGLGVTDDTPLAYWFRHERAARIYDGPDEVHKSQVAKKELAKYREDK